MDRSPTTQPALATCIFLLSLALHSAAVGQSQKSDDLQDSAGIEYFEKHIRPVLVEHCYECHSQASGVTEADLRVDARQGLLLGGQSGAPAIVPGKPDESLLIKALRYEEFEMPPDAPLSSDVIHRFRDWIEMGAPDPRQQEVEPALQTKMAAARDYWAFRKPEPSKPPAVKETAWVRDDIDRFILAKLEEQNIRPAAPATREALVRRLYFDLIGLPPSPEAIQRFVRDQRPDSVERLLDRLMALPQFGERWGRHWLDVARFAETSGGGRSLVFKNAWRYRDYVIDSINCDKPFDRFIAEQIAGDLMPYESDQQHREQLIATGFLAMGPTNYELQDKELLQIEVVDEQLDTVGKAFLGLTIGCARCHDHKFDPIPTCDYYAMAGVLGSTRSLIRGNVSNFIETELPGNSNQSRIDALREEMKIASNELEPLKSSQATLEKKLNSLGVSDKDSAARTRQPSELPGIVVDETEAETIGFWKSSDYSPNRVGKSYLHDEQTGQGTKSIIYRPDLPEDGWYVVRLAFNSAPSRASNVPVEIISDNGSQTVVVNQRVAPPDDELFFSLGRYYFRKGTQAEVKLTNRMTDGYVIADAVQFIPESISVASDRTEQATPPEVVHEINRVQQAKADLDAEVKRLQDHISDLNASIAGLSEKAMIVEDQDQPADWNLLIRGMARNLGPRIPRGFLSAFDIPMSQPISSDESGRLQLAQWLISPENPLTARVTVNRVWHHMLGRGLVRTTDNFGTTGELPSHPELLDYLAIDFVAHGWSLKRLIRKIALSRTYQQGYETNAECAEIDPDNRWLWRRNIRRMEAEAIRDAMLAISGNLDDSMRGSTFKGKEVGYQFTTARRSVYIPVLRNTRHDLLSAFDFPNANLVWGRRTVSTVPTQALYLMNSPFVQEQAAASSKRLRSMTFPDESTRLHHAYLQIVGRQPTQAEAASALSFIEQEKGLGNDAWARFYQIMFSSINFRYIE